jgi:hypothetical protein
LPACATVGTERVAKLDGNARIAPLSLMGTTLSIRGIGTTVFQNARAVAEVPDWEIDKHAESVAARVLADFKRLAVLHPDTSRFHSIKPIIGSIAVGTKFEGGADSIVAFAKEANADVVLVVHPALYGDPYFGTNQAFAGYGIYERGFLGTKNAVNYVTMRVAAFDGRTGEEIARTSGYISDRRPASDWMEFENLVMSNQSRSMTQQSIHRLIGELLTRLLSDMKLGPM